MCILLLLRVQTRLGWSSIDLLRKTIMLETNQNKAERILRILISLILLPAPFVLDQGIYTYVLTAVGAILLFNGVSGACMTYKLFGVNTCSLSNSNSEQ